MQEHTAYISSPVGTLKITSDDNYLLGVSFNRKRKALFPACTPSPILDCAKQLEEYFSGERREFDLSLRPPGTDFQLSVWRELQKIPYGEVASYGEIAKRIGNPKAMRAVGGANNANKLSIIIPCHRVIGSDGSLTGFGGGIKRKSWLLLHEASTLL